MKILIGVDGSSYSQVALDEVARRPWPAGSEILVVHAFQLPIVPTPEAWAIPLDYYEKVEQATRNEANSIVETAVAKLTAELGSGTIVNGKTVQGSAGRAIVDEATSWRADLIVVGSHGYPTWERLLLGSVSQAVVSNAKCSVEVIRGSEPKQAAA